MGRKRKSQTGLPLRWELNHGAYYYRVPAHLKGQWEGKAKFLLGHTIAEAYHTWYTRVEAPRTARTMEQAFTRFASEIVPTLAPRTQKDYLRSLSKLSPIFGHMAPSSIEPRHAYQYLDRNPGVQGNRDKAVLSAVLSQCVKWGEINANIIKGQVKRNKEKPRKRYVTDLELWSFLSFCPPFLRAYVGLKILTGIRQGQMLALRRSDWDGQRLTVVGAKGGRTVIYVGEALQDAVQDVLALRRGKALGSMYLFATRLGGPYTGDGFRSIWQRAMQKYLKAGGERFTEHDLRAKVASDSGTTAEASERMGHQTSGITERVYRRKPSEVAVLMPQSRSEKPQ